MRLHIKRTLITTFTTMILTHNLTLASTLVSTLNNRNSQNRDVKVKRTSNRIYLSPLAPVPRRASELVTVSNIDRLQRLITEMIINKLVVHRLRIDAANAAYLLAAFLTAGHRTFSPATGSPFILRYGGSGFNIVNVVIKYWRILRDARDVDSVSGCCNICVRCFLNLIKETTPYRQLYLSTRWNKRAKTIIKEIHLSHYLLNQKIKTTRRSIKRFN